MHKVVDGWLADTQNNPCYFNVYVQDKKLCLEISDKKVKQFSAPGDLMDYMDARSYALPDAERNKLNGLCKAGFRVLSAIQHSLAVEIAQLADDDYESKWVEETDTMLREVIEKTVIEEFQEIIYQLLSDSTWFLTENGKLILRGGTG